MFEEYERGRGPGVNITSINHYKGIHGTRLYSGMLQQLLANCTLQGSKPELVFLIVPDHKLNGIVAQIADTIKQYNLFSGVSHQYNKHETCTRSSISHTTIYYLKL